MLLSIFATLIGLILLVYSAEYFIEGASAIAVKFGMPKFLIGMLVIGIGTSAPEIVVSVLSAMAGSPGLALGNAYGSNIVNITLVLGATALIAPIFIQKSLVKTDFLILLIVSLIAFWQISDGAVTRLDGMILVAVLAIVLALQVFLATKNKHASHDEIIHSNTNLQKAAIKLIGGLVVLVLSSRMIVWGAVNIATAIGLSEVIIGLTIVAVGTSLPELVSSIIAAKKGEDEMALGNVIGSNIFNTLAVVGVAAIIAPMSVPQEILARDILVMLAVTALLFIMCLLALAGNQKIGRAFGAILLSGFVAYTLWLIASASLVG